MRFVVVPLLSFLYNIHCSYDLFEVWVFTRDISMMNPVRIRSSLGRVLIVSGRFLEFSERRGPALTHFLIRFSNLG